MLRTFRTTAFFMVALAGLAAANDNPPQQTHPAAFPSVTLVRLFANDAGYMLDEVIVQGKSYDRRHLRDAAWQVLVAGGWKSHNQKDREQLAIATVTQILLCDADVVQSDPGVFKKQNHPFAAPEAVLEGTGTTVRAWVHHQPQMSPGPGSYSLVSFTFDPTGQVITSASEDWDPES